MTAAVTTPSDADATTPGAPPAHLEHAVPGGVRTRRSDLLAGAHDASHYRLVPSALVVPRDAAEVGALLRAASVHGDAVTFRSGGTSLSGQSVTDDILVDVLTTSATSPCSTTAPACAPSPVRRCGP